MSKFLYVLLRITSWYCAHIHARQTMQQSEMHGTTHTPPPPPPPPPYHLAQLPCTKLSSLTPVQIAIEPTPAWRDLQAIEVVVQILVRHITSVYQAIDLLPCNCNTDRLRYAPLVVVVCHIPSRTKRVNSIVHRFVQYSAISKTHEQYMRALGKHGVQVVHGNDDVVVELLRGGHVTHSRMTVANIYTCSIECVGLVAETHAESAADAYRFQPRHTSNSPDYH
jgi:hypothetical protein